MTSQTWTNDDGLQVPFGQNQARETKSIMGKAPVAGAPVEYMVAELNFDDLPTFTADLNNDGTLNGFSDSDAYIPKGAYITRAWLIVSTGFASGTSYDLGLYEQDGTVIDANGLDAAVAVADMGANEAVDMNGQLVATQDLLLQDAYLVVAATGTYTAGVARIVIEYIQITP